MTKLRELIYPDLRRFPAPERGQALDEARHCPLDLIELLGIAAGLVCVAALTRYGVAGVSIADRMALAVVNFVVALPLLALFVGPFLIRRTRRGLRVSLRRRGALRAAA